MDATQSKLNAFLVFFSQNTILELDWSPQNISFYVNNYNYNSTILALLKTPGDDRWGISLT